MIPELEAREGWEKLVNALPEPDTLYGDEPLLGYVSIMANELCPVFTDYGLYNPDWGVDLFAGRYLNGDIDTTTSEEKYEDAIELLATLEGFEIDKDKFWYLILFLKDFVDQAEILGQESMTINEKLVSLKDALLDEKAKVNIEAKGKVDYNDALILQFLSYAIDKTLPEINQSDFYNRLKEYATGETPKISIVGNDIFHIIPKTEKKPIAMVYKQYLFNKYMMIFLNRFKQGKKRYTKINGIPTGISYDKTLLISRILYVIDYTSKENDHRFYEEWDDDGENKLNTLKNILRRYQDLDLKVDHGLYTFF